MTTAVKNKEDQEIITNALLEASKNLINKIENNIIEIKELKGGFSTKRERK